MSTEELKLYLLLLVSSVRIGHEGQIPWGILKRSLGASLTGDKIELLAEALSRHGLARMRVIHSSQEGGHQRKGSTLEVHFTVLGLGRMRGSTSRRRRRRREIGDG